MTKLKRLYIDLDSILDTRLGVLTTIDAGMAIDIIDNGDYFTRDIDIFESKKYGKLSNDSYESIKRKLPDEVIRNSIVTKITKFLLTLIYAIKDSNVNSPNKCDYILDVNTYPYVLSEEENLTLLSMIREEIVYSFDVNLIHLSDNGLTIEHCIGNYVAMVKYDYVDWMNINTVALRKKPIKTLSLYVPKLLNGVKDYSKSRKVLLSQGIDISEEEFIRRYEEYVDKLKANNVDIYEHTSLTISNLIPIVFLDISLFSVDLDIMKK